MHLFIESSKTDQFRDGAWVVLASSGKATCPVSIIARYLDKAKISFDNPLFCQLSKTKFGYKSRNKGLSYTRLRELVLEAFKGIVPDISKIGTHSFMSGEASATAPMPVSRIDFLSAPAVGSVTLPRMATCKIRCPRVFLYLRLWVSSFFLFACTIHILRSIILFIYFLPSPGGCGLWGTAGPGFSS